MEKQIYRFYKLYNWAQAHAFFFPMKVKFYFVVLSNLVAEFESSFLLVHKLTLPSCFLAAWARDSFYSLLLPNQLHHQRLGTEPWRDSPSAGERSVLLSSSFSPFGIISESHRMQRVTGLWYNNQFTSYTGSLASAKLRPPAATRLQSEVSSEHAQSLSASVGWPLNSVFAPDGQKKGTSTFSGCLYPFPRVTNTVKSFAFLLLKKIQLRW